MRLLPVSHRQQRQTSDCLAACVAMVLDYLHIPFNYGNLLRVLRIDEAGASLSNVRYLHQLGLKVELQTGELADLESYLQRGTPTIAFVNTGMLSYWRYETGHAVTVIGMDDEQVIVHDPHLAEPAMAINRIEFEAAWIELDQQYAVIAR